MNNGMNENKLHGLKPILLLNPDVPENVVAGDDWWACKQGWVPLYTESQIANLMSETMTGGMQGYTTGGGNDKLHDKIEQLEREALQKDALLANKTAHIRALQGKNLRLNKDVRELEYQIDTECGAGKEVLIAELVEALKEFVNYPADDADYPPPYAKARKALEKVGK